MNRQFLKSPGFWSALSGIVALIALILTQFPPIRHMMRGTDIKITTPEVINLGHELGNIEVNVFLDVYNAGGYTVNISRIECAILEKDTGKVFLLPARTYSTQEHVNLSLGTITLSSDQHWANDVYSYDLFKRSELEQVNDLKARIHTDLLEKRDKLPTQERPNAWIPIDDKLYQEAVDFFNKKFQLTNEGNYQFFIKAVSDSGETLKVQGFDFTLFKSNIQELRRVAERDYKHGAGIVARPRFVRETIDIPITPMSENEARAIYEQKVANR